MHKVVVDTNVVVSSHISSDGIPAKIMQLLYLGQMQMFYTAEILSEYRRVLSYGKLNIAAEAQTGIIDAIEAGGTQIDPPVSTMPMADENDRTFYDAAKATGAVLVTGNLKHYPAETFIMSPAAFYATLQR